MQLKHLFFVFYVSVLWQQPIQAQPLQQQVADYLHSSLTYQQQGDYDAAFALLSTAKSLLKQEINAKDKLQIITVMADVLLATQSLDDSTDLLLQGQKILDQWQQPDTVAQQKLTVRLWSLFASVASLEQNYVEAMAWYEKILPLTDVESRLQTQLNQARVLLAQEQGQQGLDILNSIDPQQRQSLDTDKQEFYALAIAQLYIQLARLNQQPFRPMLSLLQSVLDSDNKANKANKAIAFGHLAQIYQQEKQTKTALNLTHQAIFNAQNYPEQLYRWEAQQGLYLHQQNKITAAITAYRNALSHLHPIRNQLFSGQRNAQYIFKTHIRPVYYNLADLLLQKAATTQNKIEKQNLLFSARYTIEKYRHAELEDYFQDECVLKQNITELDNIASNTAVLYPILLDERLELLLSLADGIYQISLPVKRDDINTIAKTYQVNLQRRNSWEFLDQSSQLYDWLIRPLQTLLTDVDTLVVVPDGALRLIPLATLFDGEQYLIDRFAMAITPSITLTEPKPLPKKKITILLNGLSESVQKFSALPNVTLEVHNIEKMFTKPKTLLDKEFSLKGISNALYGVPYSIVHVASHGQFDRNPKKTFLLTHDSKLTMNHLTRLLSTSQARQHPVELLTLSACQTAVGDERAALGLAGVAVKAGARSALASLWPVFDDATALLIPDFYAQLKQTQTNKALALQQAQLKMLHSKNYQHPKYWAGFVLIGRWY